MIARAKFSKNNSSDAGGGGEQRHGGRLAGGREAEPSRIGPGWRPSAGTEGPTTARARRRGAALGRRSLGVRASAAAPRSALLPRLAAAAAGRVSLTELFLGRAVHCERSCGRGVGMGESDDPQLGCRDASAGVFVSHLTLSASFFSLFYDRNFPLQNWIWKDAMAFL